MEKHPVYQFEKYSDNACLAIAEARRWAETFHCNLLSSHFILAGLLENEADLLERFFKGQPLPVDEVLAQIRDRKKEHEPGSTNLVNVSQISLKILSRAAAEATYSQSQHIETTHILNSLIKEPKSIGSEILETVARQVTSQQVSAPKKPPQKIYSSKTHKKHKAKNKDQSLFDKFCYDLTKAARAGNLPPMVGREKELAQLLHILGRKTKNN
ncbi:MAG: ATP-dependent Clp protease ATP-binding subunit, partial [Calditrichaeota bacterium]